MRKIITLILLMFGLLVQAQTDFKKLPVQWNGYMQLRFTGNFSDINSFSMRRMKFWLNSAPGFSDHWGFHVQTTITSNQNEKFFLQDVMAYYRQGHFRINMGQFVPHYSFQRFQPDYEIPLIERADVINFLIPNGTLGVRDIGIEGNYSFPDKNIEMWLGVFNGYGIKEYRFDNSGIMLTNKTVFYFIDKHILSGFSAMYRKSEKLQLSSVLPDTVQFSGNDIRFNLFAQYCSDRFQMQAEYLWANLDGVIADGWYVLANLNFGKNQLVASYNQYNDVIDSTENSPIFHFGYNYLAKGDKLKFMLDNGIKVNNGTIRDYTITIQLQLFLN